MALNDGKHSEPTILGASLRAMKRALIFVFIFSFAVNMLSLLMPLYTLQVFDRVFTSRSIDTLLALTLVMLVGYVFYGALYAIRAGVVARIVEWLERSLAPQLLQVSIYQAAQTATPLAGQHQRDLINIKNFISGGTPTLMDIPWSALFVLVIYMINPLLGTMSVAGIIILTSAAILNEYATRKPLMRASEKQVESTLYADLLGRTADAIQGMGMNETVTARWREQLESGLNLQDMAQQRSAIIMGFSRSVRMLLQLGVIGIGAYLALNNQISAGGLIACSILMARVLAPFEGTIMLWKQFIGARDSYQRLHNLLRAMALPQGDTKMPMPLGALSVENVHYSPGKGVHILKGITFTLNPGESLGVIGPSAAGKSTLGKALMGVFMPSHGNVRLDGADVHTWNRADFGQYVGYLPQQVELFYGTLKQNIARMQENVPDGPIVDAAQRAGVHELILQFEHGYDTMYVPGNTVLSPGQKQRLGLARAIFGNPKFVVMDEPNSNLDGDGERALMNTIQWLKQQGTTAIIIAHRPSILATVDKVLMLRNGQVEVMGPRDEVMRRFTPQRVQPPNPERPNPNPANADGGNA